MTTVSNMSPLDRQELATNWSRLGLSIQGTRGFAASDEPNVAVCLLPGTELAFDEQVKCESTFGFGAKKLPYRVARFREINKDRPNVHHDALEMPDGQIVLVTKLMPGQRATVLQLPADLSDRPIRAGTHLAVA